LDANEFTTEQLEKVSRFQSEATEQLDELYGHLFEFARALGIPEEIMAALLTGKLISDGIAFLDAGIGNEHQQDRTELIRRISLQLTRDAEKLLQAGSN